MLKSRWAYLAIAVFTLAVQVAAAAHFPALHEEPVSKCRDNGAHFCAETVEQEAGPCVLCHVSLNGVFHDQLGTPSTVLQSEPVAAEAAAPLDRITPLSAHAPRGPPVG
ncbi:MAG TPA: hypothetical protein VNM14_08345 [Planctomycetota bacterium]|jgi:hypothetical protein|nr:hypothetical protein [Planctomycetota bacterium]